MAKRIFILAFILLSFQSCNRVNPVSQEDSYPPPNPNTENVVKIKIGNDFYGDTIKSSTADTFRDTSNAIDSSEVNFLIDIKNSQFGNDGGLRKALLDRVDLRDDRIDSINAITLDFISLDSSGTITRNFPIVNKTCSVTMVKIPSGHRYQVLVSLWHIQKCPWANYSIYDRSFSAVDTVDLRTENRDTLNLVFYENIRIKYFLSLKMPSLGPWTEGQAYLSYTGLTTSTPVLYKNGTLFGYYVMSDLRSRKTCTLFFSSDTDTIMVSFIPNVMTMLKNGGVVTVSADSVFYGFHESHEDSLSFVPMTNMPEHPL